MPDFSWKSEYGTDLDICSSEGNNTPQLSLGRLSKGTGFAPFLQGVNVLNFCLNVFAQFGSIQFFKIFLISASIWGWELGLKSPSKIYNNSSCKKWPYIIPGFNGSLSELSVIFPSGFWDIHFDEVKEIILLLVCCSLIINQMKFYQIPFWHLRKNLSWFSHVIWLSENPGNRNQQTKDCWKAEYVENSRSYLLKFT